ncbi:glycosyltransferase family 4 protein [Paraburkholderia sp. GAS42]|uniref:glycosyltransferase family 4 protein n=1 Tax=Paraburkholderia sp. GAS42 TaxID=3035135 RepID=UPI003D1CCD49
MKILILSFYFTPDLSAGSFRTAALVDALVKVLPSDATIEVLTTQPNRYASFNQTVPAEEVHGKVSVRRIPLPSHKSGMVDQAKAFFAYFKAVRAIVRGQGYDVVYATSSRLFTAFLGATIARRTRSMLYLDIRDIFVDTIKDVLPGRISSFGLPVFRLIERFTFNRADRINLVSAGFLPYFRERFPDKPYDCFTNGIDDAFLHTTPAGDAQPARRRRQVLYAGNIGEGQGLHRILPGLAKRCADQFEFLVVGDGGRRAALEAALAESGVDNVTISAPVSRAQLIDLYESADVLFLHLNAYEAFLKVLPSKVFEYAALGKPVLAGVDGYAREFIETEVNGAAVFPPCDVDAAEIALRGLSPGQVDRRLFTEKFKRANIMEDFAHVLKQVAMRQGDV